MKSTNGLTHLQNLELTHFTPHDRAEVEQFAKDIKNFTLIVRRCIRMGVDRGQLERTLMAIVLKEWERRER